MHYTYFSACIFMRKRLRLIVGLNFISNLRFKNLFRLSVQNLYKVKFNNFQEFQSTYTSLTVTLSLTILLLPLCGQCIIIAVIRKRKNTLLRIQILKTNRGKVQSIVREHSIKKCNTTK